MSQLLLKRAKVHEQLDNLDQARADLQTAIQRDPSNQQAKDDIQRLYTLSSTNTTTTPSSEPKATKEDDDPLATRFQKYLRQVSASDNVDWIKSFVKSTDFVDVLAACGGGRPDNQVSAYARSTAYMILTKLFNPPPDMQTNYPLQLIISTCAACFSQCIDTGKNAEKLLAYRTLHAIFETSMTIGAAILSQEGVVEEMMDVIDFEIVSVQTAMVEVLAIASADKTCHKLLVKHASQWLAFTATRGKDERLKALAGTTLSKLQTHQRYQDKNLQTSSSDQQEDTSLQDAMNKMNLGASDLTDAMLVTIKNFKTQDTTMLLNAIEGLAYASLQADVKETVANDPVLLKSLVTIAINTTGGGGDTTTTTTTTNHPLLYGIGTILRNVTMYRPVLDEQQKQMKRLRDLANARNKGGNAKGAEEEDDPRESDTAVEIRVRAAVESGAALALFVLAKAGSSSSNLRMVASQTYLNLVTPQATRGKLLQQGVAKGLMMLIETGKDDQEQQLVAAQAIARLAITADPRLAFGAQASLDLVRPFLRLCKADQALRQFEGLMALTNLASVDDAVRFRIYSEDGMTVFEGLQLASNELVQRAATEMVCNMTFCDPVFESYSKSPNRLRLLMVFSDHEDAATRRAASGALAILANSKDACERMANVDKAYERLTRLVAPEEPADIQHRGVEIIRLMIQHLGKDAAQGFASEHAHTKLTDIVKKSNVNVVRSAAMEVLKMFVENGVQLK